MKNYESLRELRALWEKAVKLYGTGQRGAASYFTHAEVKTLAGHGHTAQEVYDFAEDFTNGGEPTLEDFIAVAEVRREFFLEVQKGKLSATILDMNTLPPKTASVKGIEWLPRILPKAKAKLHGEMPPELMYGCGGDRRFFRDNDIHPAEFLRIIWANLGNDEAVINWVVARNASK
ncbi:MAG: DUF5069 domain-containing protein [Verrucomicrobiota bacterium]|nr:DUF5069 domain-containing protein [Verrucomicrobiota bacterium]